ncbi:mobility-associated LCxxNW protein [Blautia coccoides]|uniref:mobility-associated LCxxNW protein n=1 Tax=Blautia producta TaxID=33035 RepID=UPI0028A3C198|nr:mobility-associated LCxxNW protein [Blautia coccoides]MDT4376927.1 mobility-associated LCxxNW protein [Blautia coccoides]
MVFINPIRKKVAFINDYCAFSKDHHCLKWTDYEVTRFELEEADELCHGNWIEIHHLQDRVNQLEQLLKDSGIEVPPEY